MRMDNTMKDFSSALAAQLRAEKAASGLTLDRLVEVTGASKMTIRRYLSGERAVPVPHFALIADALGVEPGALIARAQDRM